MSLHKLTAGDGYTYLTRQVAAADATDLGRTPLGDFYAAKGESPGVWAGSGLSGLDGVDPGDHVSAEQMKALFGEGRHPNADSIGTAMIASGHTPSQALRASRLGYAFYGYNTTRPLRVEVTKAIAQHNMALGLAGNARVTAEVRTQIRTDVGTEMFMDWHGRPPADLPELSGFIASASRPATTAVAGFDLVFSPVKSVSALWAIASPQVSAQIQQAQQCAVADTLGWLERDAAFTRTGTRSACHVEVTGLIATIFTHRDSRSGDPDLHTHVAISNKVQTLSGAWMALHSRVLFKSHAAAGARYDTRIEAELTARLGVRFEARFATSGKRAIREISGVDPALNTFWSSRTADILVHRAALVAAFQVGRGRAPTAIELERLGRQATLETRPAKHSPRSLAGQRATWAAQARQVLGGDFAVAAMLEAATGSHLKHHKVSRQPVTGQWVGASAAAVVATVAVSCHTWQVWHVRAEAERVARSAGVALGDLDRAVDAVVASALSPVHAVPVTGQDPAVDPAVARRRDGSSVYSMPGAARFTSRAAIKAEAYLATTHRTGRPAEVLEVTLAKSTGVLSPDLARPALQMATSGTRLPLAPAPAESARTGAATAGSEPQPCREDGSDAVAEHEALFHAARQRDYWPAADLDAFETERQLAETNRWEQAPVPRPRLVELNQLAADFFTAGYPQSWGPAYVTGRLGTDLGEHPDFRPGYAPAGWTNLIDHLRSVGAGDQEILAAGLGQVAATGAIIDLFRGRLILPIRNGQVIHGFIGRRHPSMDDNAKAGPKYLNTPHTDLFDKSQQLFGLAEGQGALEAGATPVLVEGFFDAMAVTLAGDGHHVGLACMGTSFTTSQANQLRPYIGAQHGAVIVATDTDLAGEIAAERAFWMLCARGDAPRHVLLVGGRDPAEVLEHAGPMVLRACLHDAHPLGRHLLDERLGNIGQDPGLLPQCAAIIAAQPPGEWVEQIDYAATRTGAGQDAIQEAVADAAQRWTLDPLGRAQAQIGNLSGVRARRQGAAQTRPATGKAADFVVAEDVATTQGPHGAKQPGQPRPNGSSARADTQAQELSPPQRWRQLAASIDSRLTAGLDWPLLSRAIQEADSAGYDVALELAQLVAGGQFFSQHPATELAHRLQATTAAFSDIAPASSPGPKAAAISPAARSHLSTRPTQSQTSRPVG